MLTITLNDLPVDVTKYVERELNLEKPAAVVAAILTWCEITGIHPDRFEKQYDFHKEEVRQYKLKMLRALSEKNKE